MPIFCQDQSDNNWRNRMMVLCKGSWSALDLYESDIDVSKIFTRSKVLSTLNQMNHVLMESRWLNHCSYVQPEGNTITAVQPIRVIIYNDFQILCLLNFHLNLWISQRVNQLYLPLKNKSKIKMYNIMSFMCHVSQFVNLFQLLWRTWEHLATILCYQDIVFYAISTTFLLKSSDHIKI